MYSLLILVYMLRLYTQKMKTSVKELTFFVRIWDDLPLVSNSYTSNRENQQETEMFLYI